MSRAKENATETEGAQSIQRALRVLRYVASQGTQFPSAAKVAEDCALTKPTSHRILAALTSERFLRTEDRGRRYGLGVECYFLGLSASSDYSLLSFADPSINRIAAVTGDTCFLSVRSGDEAICIGTATGDFPIKILTLKVGDRRPLGVGAGSLALLAFMPDEERKDVLQRVNSALARYPHFSAASMEADVVKSVEQGHAYNPGRLIPEMSAVGIPIYGVDGELIGALSVAALTSRLDASRTQVAVALMKEEAKKIANAVAARRDGRGDGRADGKGDVPAPVSVRKSDARHGGLRGNHFDNEAWEPGEAL